MSYTIPEGIQAKADAVLAVASVIADEDKSALGDGSVNTALDVLADTLAGQDVEVPQTNAGAILALAGYVGGGGGAQKHPITVDEGSQGNFGFYVHDATGQWTVPVTELEGGVPFVIKEEDGKALTGDNLSLEADYTIPVMYGFDSMQNQAFAIMPNSELHVYLYIE